MKYSIHEIKDLVDLVNEDKMDEVSEDKIRFLMNNPKWLDEEYQNIAWSYLVDGMPANQIAKHCFCGRTTVGKKLKRLNIPLRDQAESIHLSVANHCKVDPIKDTLTGNLLGDGGLESQSKYSAKFALFSIHKEYVDWLSGIYSKGNIEMSLWIKEAGEHLFPNGKIYQCKKGFRIRSQSCAELRKERVKWYPNEEKIIPRDIELTPLTCLLWYLDDGTNGGERKGLRLCTNNFTLKDVQFLKNLLESTIGIKTSIYMQKGEYPTIGVKKNSKDKFLYYILPEFPDELIECFGYKFKA